jgi:monofunctional biosynthetic peptidoglycan transglycosylase
LALIQLAVIFARVALLTTSNPSTTAYIRQYLNRCSQEKGDCRFEQSWKPLGEISIHLQEAVLIGEDDAFFEHEGIDPEAIQESLELNLKKKKIVRGGSTITQQLVKNLYLSPSKNPYRKLKEIVIALFMEKMLTKQRILEIYLNVIQWGKGIYGAEAASQFYFHKPAQSLSQEEAASLAAIIPNPEYLTDPAHSKRALRRKAIILQRMQHRSYPDLSMEEQVSRFI